MNVLFEHMGLSLVIGILFTSSILFTIASVAGASIPVNNVAVFAIKTDSAVISWDTTLPGTSQIIYGNTTFYGSNTPEDSLSYFHTIELTGLLAGTTYHYRIKSKEYNGEETLSPDYTFTTRTQAQLEAVIKAAREDKGLPKIYYVKTMGNDANDGLTIAAAWKSPSYAVSKADVGDTIYVLPGTYAKEYIIFPRSGIDIATITLSAYDMANKPHIRWCG